MALKVQRRDDLDAMFGKFAQMDPKDKERDKFLKRTESTKKARPLIDSDQKHNSKSHDK